MLKLYPDQQDTIDRLRQAMTRDRAVLLQSPTGSGKTAMAIWLIGSACGKGKRTLFTVPRRELMRQTSETFSRYGISHSHVAAGKPFNPYAKHHVGMVDTMARRIHKGTLPEKDLVIVDETHFGAGSLDAVINYYKDQGAWVIGLSATPWKLSGQGLGCWYDNMVQGKDIEWLIENKRLSDYRYFRGKTKPDFSGIKVTAGDYNKGQLAEYMEEQGVIIGDCVNDYRTKAMGRLHVVRCTSIKHSRMTEQSFRNAGIPAQHVDGNTCEADMRQIVRAYAKREILVLTFCDLLNFGFDLSQASGLDVCIESCSDLKPSKSLAGQMQYWGRALRYKEEPALIFDNVNNYLEHGLPCSKREWTLADRKQGKRQSERVPPTRQCMECFHIHTPAPKCPECGYEYPTKSREVDEVEGELEEVDKKMEIKQRKQEQGSAQSLEALIALGKSRGYKHPTAWAAKVMAGRLKGKSR